MTCRRCRETFTRCRLREMPPTIHSSSNTSTPELLTHVNSIIICLQSLTPIVNQSTRTITVITGSAGHHFIACSFTISSHLASFTNNVAWSLLMSLQSPSLNLACRSVITAHYYVIIISCSICSRHYRHHYHAHIRHVITWSLIHYLTSLSRLSLSPG